MPEDIYKIWRYPSLTKPDICDKLKHEYRKHVNNKSVRFTIRKCNRFLRVSYLHQSYFMEISLVLKWDDLINIKRMGLHKFLKVKENCIKQKKKYKTRNKKYCSFCYYELNYNYNCRKCANYDM